MRPVLILGATGMLGQGVLRAFSGFAGNLCATTRDGRSPEAVTPISTFGFNAITQRIEDLSNHFLPGTLIVNCIGVIKPYIHDDNQLERDTAIRVNSVFPYHLASFAESNGHQVIQIATDCVYSGKRGQYCESDEQDALDVYGKSKALGEVPSPNMMHIRASIIGPEAGRSSSLFEWVRNQPIGATIGGFTDHVWNGITTFSFGKIARGIAETDGFEAGTFHLIPGNIVTKESLVRSIATICGREDIQVEPRESGTRVDRTLSTLHSDLNGKLWRDAGYSTPPTIEEMLSEIF